MSAPDDGHATALVIVLKPGCIYVKIAEPRPEPDRIQLLLRLTIDQWFRSHPNFAIDKTQAVIEHGDLLGIHVWYHEDARRRVRVSFNHPEQPHLLEFEVDDEIHQRVPRERMEAILREALKNFRRHEKWQGTLVAISPGRIAVILDKQVDRGEVLPIEFVCPRLEASTRIRVRSWLRAPTGRRHVVLIDGSWFLPHKDESRRNRVVEPNFLRTNMTYDTGARRPEFDGGGGYAG